MMFTARNALVSRLRMRWIGLITVAAIQLSGVAVAGDGSVSEVLVWAQEGPDIIATYARDRDGLGYLRFREGRRSLSVNWLVESDKDLIANMSLASMQHFNGLFVVTLESASGYVIQIYTYDEARETVNEVASTNARWLPELMYFGDQADPAVGVMRQQANSKGKQPALLCGQKIFTYNRSARRVDEISMRWSRGVRGEVGKLDASCVD